MHAATLLRLQARANRLANHRLHLAMATLTAAELHAPRSSFFPTLMATLNHVLAVDQYYVGALHGDAGLAEHWHRYLPDRELAPLAGRQRLVDERLIACCDALDDAGCERTVEMPRRAGVVQRDAAAFVLQHLFMHQTHHRGQVHAMLSGTAVSPPQLDEFLMPSDAPLRSAEMAALGWDEAAVYGHRI
ncbi:MAG: DinB family protein [Rubrivivax sp.]|nr:DinB family protein [Rubrivivax sp.]